jgi:hypothetical protein
MTDETPPLSEEPTAENPAVPVPEAAPAPPAAPPPPPGPSLGHVVLGAVLVLIGVGWLLEALDVVNVPWRLLLPSVLILVGLALALGARRGRHGGLIAAGIVLTMLVLAAGAVEVLTDVPLSGGVGDRTYRPAGTVAGEYRWGVGKMTLDLRSAPDLAGREIAASLVIGDLIVIVPDDVTLRIEARAGIGEVGVLGHTADGIDPGLECGGRSTAIDCSAPAAGERVLRLDLAVGLGKVEVQR